MTKDPFTRSILPDIPDFYVDRVRLTVTVFGVNFTFGLGAPHPDQQKGDAIAEVLELVRLRMSLEHTKVLAMLLKKQVKNYERNTGTEVALPQGVLESLEITDEEW